MNIKVFTFQYGSNQINSHSDANLVTANLHSNMVLIKLFAVSS